MAVTSAITPSERLRTTWWTSASAPLHRSTSTARPGRGDGKGPCLRISAPRRLAAPQEASACRHDLVSGKRSACSIPACRSPTVFLPRSTPMATMSAHFRRQAGHDDSGAEQTRASTVCLVIGDGGVHGHHAVMSMTTTLARLVRIPRSAALYCAPLRSR
jgi:hypothetical protein